MMIEMISQASDDQASLQSGVLEQVILKTCRTGLETCFTYFTVELCFLTVEHLIRVKRSQSSLPLTSRCRCFHVDASSLFARRNTGGAASSGRPSLSGGLAHSLCLIGPSSCQLAAITPHYVFLCHSLNVKGPKTIWSSRGEPGHAVKSHCWGIHAQSCATLRRIEGNVFKDI